MANPAVSLNRAIQWHKLLDLLGVQRSGLVLPATINCPLCQTGVLTISEDRLLGGQWFYCAGCNKSGDLIQLAAKTWNLNITDTIVRLNRNGFDVPAEQETIDTYVRQHVSYRNRLHQLRKQSKEGIKRASSTVQHLISKLGLRCDGFEQRWESGPGRILGAIDKTAAERCFAPGVMKHADTLQQKSSPSAHAIFKGKGWDDVLVVPYFDMQWRIRSFLFIGRDGEPEQDFVYKLANLAAANQGPDATATDLGLALHPRVLELAADWDDSVIAIKDPVLALRLQMRNFEQSLHPLPIVNWHDTDGSAIQTSNKRPARTTHAWQILGNNKIIFWMPEFCLATLRQAISQDGLLSTVGPRKSSGTNLKEFCYKKQPRDLLRHVQKGAKPWPIVLARKLERMTDAQVEQLFLRLQLAGEDIHEIAKRCGVTVQRRLKKVLADNRIPKTIAFDGYTILEQDKQWFVQGKKYQQPELISDAVLRLDQVLYQKKTELVYYQGRILYQNHEVAFCELADTIKINTAQWMRDQLIKASIGYLNYHGSWAKKLDTISERFHGPQLRHIPGSIGWDWGDHQFVLPRFTIGSQGKIELHDAGLFPEDTPARQLLPPEGTSPEELQRPSYHDELAGAVFWATTTAVLSNILAPVCGEVPSGIMLSGVGAQALGTKIVEAFGCPVHRMTNARETRLALVAEQDHAWPVLFHPAYSLQRRQQKQLVDGLECTQRNCVLRANFHEASAKALEGSWQVILAERPVAIRPDVLSMAGRLLPNYLQDLAKRDFQLEHWDDPAEIFTEEVLRDLAYFVDARNGDPEDVFSAREVLWSRRDGGHALPLADLLARFIRVGKLSIEDDCRRGLVLTRVAGGGLLVRHTALQKLLQQEGIAMPNPISITAVLAQKNVLIEDREDGWVIDRDWFEQRQRYISAMAAGPMGVVSA